VTPDEIRLRLAETDQRLVEALRGLGFTPEEIERQLDPNVPDEVKRAEREAALQRKLVADLNDPRSGVLDALLDKVATEVEGELEAGRKARRRRRILGALLVVAIAGIAIWYFALRDTRSDCQRIVGTQHDIELVTGQNVDHTFHYSGKYACTLNLDGDTTQSILEIDVEEHGYTTPPDEAKFARVEPFGTGKLYIAGNEKEQSPDELLAQAKKNAAAGSHDAIGAALAASPQTRHVMIVPVGARDLRITFDRVVPLDRAKAYAAVVEGRLRKLD